MARKKQRTGIETSTTLTSGKRGKRQNHRKGTEREKGWCQPAMNLENIATSKDC
jgi:hypothetical protein